MYERDKGRKNSVKVFFRKGRRGMIEQRTNKRDRQKKGKKPGKEINVRKRQSKV
jgi:hypothetical protein